MDPCAVLARPQLICRDLLFIGQLEIVGVWNRSCFRFRIRVRARFWFRSRGRFRFRFRFPFSLRFRFRFWLVLVAERLDQALLLGNFARRDRGDRLGDVEQVCVGVGRGSLLSRAGARLGRAECEGIIVGVSEKLLRFAFALSALRLFFVSLPRRRCGFFRVGGARRAPTLQGRVPLCAPSCC